MAFKEPEETKTPVTPPEGGQLPVTPPEGAPPEATLAQPSIYNDLATKKGFKSQDDFAKNYTELESDRSRKDNALNQLRQTVETNSGGANTIDDKGNVVSTGQPAQPQAQPQGGYGQPQGQYGQPQGQEVWDEQQQKYVTDPIEVNFARNNTPMYHRQAMIAQAVISQNEALQRKSFENDTAVLSTPEAKGFEDDVRKYMQTQPANVKANKQSWETALKIVKGTKFDELKKTMGQEAVDKFLNKASVQPVPSAGGGAAVGGVSLTPDQERTFQWYVANQPTMFKDRKDFSDSLGRNR